MKQQKKEIQLQIHHNQQKHIQMEQNREPGNNPMHLLSINLNKGRHRILDREKTVSSNSGIGKIEQVHVKQ